MKKLNLKQFKIKLAPDSKAIQGLQAGDIVRRQYTDNNESIYSLMIVTDNGKDEVLVKQKYVDVYWFSAILIDGDEPKQGQLLDFVRVGNLYNPDRTGALYLTASDSKAPYMDVIDGIGVENSLYHPTEDKLDTNNSYQHKESENVLAKFLKTYQSQNNALNFTKTDNAGCSAEINKILHIQDTQRVIVSFAAKSNKESSIVVSAGDEQNEVLVTTDWKFNVLTFHNESDGNYTFSLDLANALKGSGDEVVISDLNITTLAAISTFLDANKGRIGKIDGISDTIFGSLDGYGAYFQKFYATKDVAIAGTLTAGDKNGFGSTFYVGKIHKNCLTNSLYGNFVEKVAPSQTLPITGVGAAFDLTNKITVNAQTKEWADKHKEKDYCFSLWLKGKGKMFVEYLGEKIARFEVNELWNRYSCTFKIKPNFPVHIVLNGAGVFCSPQLEEGKTPSPYQPTDANLNYTDEYGAWFSRGGIGGTIQNPLLKLNEDGSIESGKGNFKIHANGNAEFEGKVTANEGNIAGWEIQKNKLAKNGLEINSDGHISGSENGKTKWKIGKLDGTKTEEFGELTGNGVYVKDFYGVGDFKLKGSDRTISQQITDIDGKVSNVKADIIEEAKKYSDKTKQDIQATITEENGKLSQQIIKAKEEAKAQYTQAVKQAEGLSDKAKAEAIAEAQKKYLASISETEKALSTQISNTQKIAEQAKQSALDEAEKARIAAIQKATELSDSAKKSAISDAQTKYEQAIKEAERLSDSAKSSAIQDAKDKFDQATKDAKAAAESAKNEAIKVANDKYTQSIAEAQKYADSKSLEAQKNAEKTTTLKYNELKKDIQITNESLTSKYNSLDVETKNIKKANEGRDKTVATIQQKQSELKQTTDGLTAKFTNDIEENRKALQSISSKTTQLEGDFVANNKQFSAKHSELTKAIEKTTKQLNETESKIDGLKIGGRNLVRNSSLGEMSDADELHLYTFSSSEIGTYTLSIDKVLWFDDRYHKHTDEDSKDTLHIRFWSVDNKDWVEKERGMPYKNGERRVCTFEITKEMFAKSKTVELILNNQSQYLDLHNIKLEKGNTPTAWSPAPEDVITVTQKSLQTTEERLQSAFNKTSRELTSEFDAVKKTTEEIKTSNGERDKKVVEIEKNYSQLKQTAEGIKADFRTTKETVDETKKKIDGLKVGGRNLMVYSQLRYGYLTHTGNNLSDPISGVLSIKRSGLSSDEYAHKLSVINISNRKTDTLIINTNGDEYHFLRYAFFTDNPLSDNVKKTQVDTGFHYIATDLLIPDSGKLLSGNTKVSVFLTIPKEAKYFVFSSDTRKHTGVNYGGRRWKIELGTTPTDYTPAPEDIESEISTTKTELTSKIEATSSQLVSTIEENKKKWDNLKVGGRNYILNSTFKNGLDKWGDWAGGEKKAQVVDGYSCCSIQATNAIYRGIDQRFNLGEVPVETYTLSFYARKISPNGSSNLSYIIHYNNADRDIMYQHVNSVVLTDKWERYTDTISYTEYKKLKYFNLMLGTVSSEGIAGSTNCYVANIKLEEGRVPTDYTPAPEDIGNEISTTKTQIQQTKDEIALKAKEIDGLKGRVSEAEQKITPDAITSVVKSNLKVGGRNLLLRSHTFKGREVSAIANIEKKILDNGNLYIKRTSSGPHCCYIDTAVKVDGILNEGDSFVLTFWAKRISGEGTLRVHPNTSIREYYDLKGEISDKDFNPLSYVGTWKGKELELHLALSGHNGEFEIEKIKFEKGNVPTDWTPAPEDIEAQIEDVSTQIKQTKDTVSLQAKSIDNLSGRMKDAELKINPDNIRSVVKGQTEDIAKELLGGVRTVIDAGGLYESTYYLVTIQLSSAKPQRHFQLFTTLGDSYKPSWATHSQGFSCMLRWSSVGSGWGCNEVVRNITDFGYRFTKDNVSPVGNLGQITENSEEYFYVRGGGRYFLYSNTDVTPVLHKERYYPRKSDRPNIYLDPKGSVTPPQTRYSSVQTEINQTKDAIKLKADQTEVDKLGERVSAAELKVTPDAITSVVKTGGRNLLRNSEKWTVDNLGKPHTYCYDILTKVEAGTYTFSVDLEDCVNTHEATALLLSADYKKVIGEHRFNDTERGAWTFTLTKEECSPSLPSILLYAGIAGQTQNKKVTWKNIKLEKGSVATLYTPAPEDVIAVTNQAGRNLLRYSNTDKVVPYQREFGNWSKNGKTITINSDEKWNSFVWVQSYITKQLEVGSDFVFSFDITSNKSCRLRFALVYYWSATTECMENLEPNKTKRIVIKGNVKEGNTAMFAGKGVLFVINPDYETEDKKPESQRYKHKGLQFTVSNLMLTEGTTEVPYSLAPEDVEEMQTTITQTKDSIKAEVLQGKNGVKQDILSSFALDSEGVSLLGKKLNFVGLATFSAVNQAKAEAISEANKAANNAKDAAINDAQTKFNNAVKKAEQLSGQAKSDAIIAAKSELDKEIKAANGYSDKVVNELTQKLGLLAYSDKIGKAVLDETVIAGGFINTTLINAESIASDRGFVNKLLANELFVKNLTARRLLVNDENGNVLAEFDANKRIAKIGGFEVVNDGIGLESSYGEDAEIGGGHKLVQSLNLSKYGIHFKRGIDKDYRMVSGLGASATGISTGMNAAAYAIIKDNSNNVGYYANIQGGFANHALYISHGDICGLRYRTTVVSRDYTLSPMDTFIIIDSKNKVRFTLPKDAEDGQMYMFANINSGRWEVHCQYGDKIHEDRSGDKGSYYPAHDTTRVTLVYSKYYRMWIKWYAY